MAEVSQDIEKRKEFLEPCKTETMEDGNEIIAMDLETNTQVDIGVQDPDSEVSIQEPSTARLVVILLGLWVRTFFLIIIVKWTLANEEKPARGPSQCIRYLRTCLQS